MSNLILLNALVFSLENYRRIYAEMVLRQHKSAVGETQ